MHFLELPKIDKDENEDRLAGWMQFLAAGTKEELQMLARGDDVYQKAYQQLEILSLDETTKQQYEAREAWLRDEATRQYEAENRGWRKGLQEGEAKGRIEGKAEGEITTKLSVALAQLNILNDATIANTLSLPIEMVQRLRAGEDVEKIQEE